MNSKRSERPYIKLSNYIPSEYFRTADSISDYKCSPNEIPVRVGTTENFRNKLSFTTPWDGQLFGYIRKSSGFLALCAEMGLDFTDINEAYFEDWGSKFIFIIATKKGETEPSFAVEPDEVRSLLENCMRIPAQRVSK